MSAKAKYNSNVPQGLIDTGKTITIPLPIFYELLESDPHMALKTPVIPLYTPVRWADERICCHYARSGNVKGSQKCEILRRDDDDRTWCALNGSKEKSPCVFAEPENSEIWGFIRGQIRMAQENMDAWSERELGQRIKAAFDGKHKEFNLYQDLRRAHEAVCHLYKDDLDGLRRIASGELMAPRIGPKKRRLLREWLEVASSGKIARVKRRTSKYSPMVISTTGPGAR